MSHARRNADILVIQMPAAFNCLLQPRYLADYKSQNHPAGHWFLFIPLIFLLILQLGSGIKNSAYASPPYRYYLWIIKTG